MGPVDLLITAAILAATGWLLYRSLVKRGGACGHCSQQGACHSRRQEVVRLGGGKGRPAT
ncbi:MAG TPA: hypothetical protein VLT61_13585 [Anaeromyxobacteraceae bacterium]|nr:hypothetical protein [Anaeromyxobacteraceae bacterium]